MEDIYALNHKFFPELGSVKSTGWPINSGHPPTRGKISIREIYIDCNREGALNNICHVEPQVIPHNYNTPKFSNGFDGMADLIVFLVTKFSLVYVRIKKSGAQESKLFICPLF